MRLAEGEERMTISVESKFLSQSRGFVCRYPNCPSGIVKFYYTRAEVLHYICFLLLRSSCC